MDPAVLEIEGAKAQILVVSCALVERIGAPLEARVRATAWKGQARRQARDLDLAGKTATLALRYHEVHRTFVGRVGDVIDAEDASTLVLSHGASKLRGEPRRRTFTDLSAIDVANRVVAERGLKVDLRSKQRPASRAVFVQALETDLDFVARILAEEGMTWLAKAADLDAIAVVDEPSTFADVGLELDFRPGAARAIVSAKLCAGSPEAPLVLEGESTAPDLEAGFVFELRGAPLAAMNGPWLVIEVTHDAKARGALLEVAYASRFRAVPAKSGFRPALARTALSGFFEGERGAIEIEHPTGARLPPAAASARGLVALAGDSLLFAGRVTDEPEGASAVSAIGWTATSDMRERVGRDKDLTVGGDERRTIAQSWKLVVEDHVASQTTGASSLDVGTVRKVTAARLAISADAEAVHVGGDQNVRAATSIRAADRAARIIARDRHETASERADTVASGSWTQVVAGSSASSALGVATHARGDARVKVLGSAFVNAGSRDVEIGGACGETATTRATVAGGDIQESSSDVNIRARTSLEIAAPDVVFDADRSLTIRAGGVTVEMTPRSIEIHGRFDGATESAEEGTHRYG